MPEPTRAELELLLALQATETEIRRLERRLEDLPEQAALDAASEAAAATKADQDARRVDLELVEAEMRRLEGDLALLQQRRDAERTRLYGGVISNPRELQSLRAELDSVDRRIATLENSLLEVMERREELAGDADTIGRRREELHEQQERLSVARDEAAQVVLAKLAAAKADRDAERESLSDQLIARYEASKRRYGGIGISALEEGVCTGCHLQLTPLEISELRNSGPLGTCPQCQRLLVFFD